MTLHGGFPLTADSSPSRQVRTAKVDLNSDHRASADLTSDATGNASSPGGPRKLNLEIPMAEVRSDLASRLGYLLSEVPWLPTLVARYRMFVFPKYSGSLITKLGSPLRVDLLDRELVLDLSAPHDCDMLGALKRYGLYEPETSRFLLGRLNDRTVFVDVGANNGYFAILASTRIRAGHGRVYALEPNPRPFRRLLRNVAANGLENLVFAYCLAAGRQESRASLSGTEFDDSWGKLGSSVSQNSIPVQTVRLDSVVRDPEDLVVKVDVEGSELDVIEGMGTMVNGTRSATLIVEWNRNYGSRDLWTSLHRRWNVFRIDPSQSGYELTRVRDFNDVRRRALCNLACFPR